MPDRDEFAAATKRILGERSAYFCSNPDCRTPTIGPHSDPGKSLKTGDACHIEAAAAGGPRYNAEQTTEQRRDIANGIWLCADCSRRIDADPARFPVDKLRQWKRETEDWLLNGGIVPALPVVKIVTNSGLTLPDEPGTITGADIAKFRELHFSIRNDSYAEIFDLNAEIHLPEPVLRPFDLQKPAVVDVRLEPIRPTMTVWATGGGSVTRNRPAGPPIDLRLKIDRQPAQSEVSFRMHTSDEPLKSSGIFETEGIWADLRKPPNLKEFVDGIYAFPYQGATIRRRFFTALRYDQSTRVLTSEPTAADQGDWQLPKGELMY